MDSAELAGAIPPPPRFTDTVQPKVYNLALLGSLGIASRGVTSAESRAALTGRYVYDDMPGALERYAEGGTFSATRIDIDAVRRVANAYMGGVGSAAQAPATSESLGAAASRYMTLSQASSVDPAEFRSYLENTPEEGATLAQIQRLENMLADMRNLGLPPGEAAQARVRLIASLSSETLPPDALGRALRQPTP